MIIEDLADFIASPEGELYGRYCSAYGKDPGAIFSDDVIAFEVGVAYMMREAITQDDDESVEDWEAAGAANEREWLEQAAPPAAVERGPGHEEAER